MSKANRFISGFFVVSFLSVGILLFAQAAAASASQTTKDIERAWLLKQALPGAERFETVDKGGIEYEVGYRGSQVIGGVFYAEGKGYGGPMQFMVGLDPQGRVVEIFLVSHRESKGLGTKVTDPVFLSQFRGRSGPFILKKDDPLGDIDSVAKATLSTRGVIMAVEEAVRTFKELWAEPE